MYRKSLGALIRGRQSSFAVPNAGRPRFHHIRTVLSRFSLFGVNYQEAESAMNSFQGIRNENQLEGIAIHALRQGIRESKCSRERLWHFARICRVARLVRIVDSYKPT